MKKSSSNNPTLFPFPFHGFANENFDVIGDYSVIYDTESKHISPMSHQAVLNVRDLCKFFVYF